MRRSKPVIYDYDYDDDDDYDCDYLHYGYYYYGYDYGYYYYDYGYDASRSQNSLSPSLSRTASSIATLARLQAAGMLRPVIRGQPSLQASLEDVAQAS